MDIKPFVKHRKYLHQHPEISGEEDKTANYIKKQLAKISSDFVVHQVANTGVLAILNTKKQGKHIMFRCELDALPIEEQNTFKHKSKINGKSHKCGHDGHMAIMLAFAQHLVDYSPKKGMVSLLFQPAEENGEGARSVIEDEVFKKECYPDYVFALHNVPGYDKDMVITKSGTFTPSVISANITLIGKTAHAAEPENGINPAYAIAEMMQKIKEIEIRDTHSSSFRIITPIFIEVGSESYGVAAGNGRVGLTLRTWSNSMMDKLRESFLDVLLDVVQEHDLEYQIEWLQEFKSVKNDKKSTELVQNAAIDANLNCMINEKPFKWGEDFGLFTEKFSGAMFALGAGKDTPALHNPDYDFPDELISSGCKMFANILAQFQK